MKLISRVKQFFNGRSGRSKMVIKNAAGSFIVKIGSMAIDFIKVPIYLSFLDASFYGVYLTIASIVAWTHKFDFGLGTGLRYKLTQAISLNDEQRGKQLVSTAYISMSAIMLFIIVICTPIICCLDWPDILNCNFIGASELILCVCMILAVFAVQFVLELISVVLQANQRAAISSVFKPLANLISLLTIIALRFYYHNSLVLACIALTVPIVVVLFIANVYLFKKKYNRIAPSFKDFQKGCIRDIYSLGIKYFASQLSSLIVFSTASFLLSHYINPTEAAVYNTAWAYFGIIVGFNAMVLHPLIAAVTDAQARGEMGWVKNIFKKINLYSLALTVCELLLVLISPLFFKLWLGDKLTISISISIAMTMYFIVNIWVHPYTNFVSGVGKMNISVVLSICKILLFFPVAIAMIKWLGTVGLVLSILVVNTFPNLIIGVIQYNLIITNRAKGIWNK